MLIDAVDQVERIIYDFWTSAPSNSVDLETGERAWAKDVAYFEV